MKNKILIVLITLLLLIPASVFAGDLFGLKIGPTVTIDNPISLDDDFSLYLDSISAEQIYYGVDLRFNASIFELSTLFLPMEFAEVEGVYSMEALAIPGIGVSVELLGLIDVAVSVGPYLYFTASSDGAIEYLYGSVLEDMPIMGRLTADVNLGPVSLGAYVLFNSDYVVGDILNSDFDTDSLELPSTGYLGVSVLLNLL